MPDHVLIVGVGIWRVDCPVVVARARVTVIEGGHPAGQASGRSFGLTNASFFADDAYFSRARWVLPHIIVSPELEFRQDAVGCIIAPHSTAHHSDTTEALELTPQDMAEDTMVRLRRMMPDVPLEWDGIKVALCQVLEDGLHVVGLCGPAGYILR